MREAGLGKTDTTVRDRRPQRVAAKKDRENANRPDKTGSGEAGTT